MTDASIDATATAAPDLPDPHVAKLAELARTRDQVTAQLETLRDALNLSLAKAATDPDHASYTEAFLRDVSLKSDEIVAWIKRHL